MNYSVRQHLAPYLHAVAVVFFAPVVLAQAAEPTVSSALLLQTSAAPETSVADTSELDYLQAIESLEGEFGPWHTDLAQHLASLGNNLRQNGQLEQAREALERAMHLSRINEGLYSLNQVPILEQLIETNVAEHDWQAASENHQYLFWLHRRNYSADDPRMLPTLNKLSRWHLNAFFLGVDGGLAHHLINAHNLFSSSAAIIEHAFGASDLRLVDALRGLTVSSYYLAAYPSYAPSEVFEANFNTGGIQDDEQIRLQQFILRSYSSGRDAIERIRQVYEENPQAPADAALKAQIELADWQLLFDRPKSAMELYQSTIAAFSALPGGDRHIDDLFGEPIKLPILSFMEQPLQPADNTGEYVLVRFDVNSRGRALNIDILESFPEDKLSIRVRVRDMLKSAKFRPRFENGEPVDTVNLTRRYVFAD